MAQGHVICQYTMRWVREIHDIHFTMHDVPFLHAVIHYLLQYSYDNPSVYYLRGNLENVIIKSSNEYLDQKRRTKLNMVSQKLDCWQKEDNAKSAEQWHLVYLHYLHRIIAGPSETYDESIDGPMLLEMLEFRLEFMMKHHRNLYVVPVHNEITLADFLIHGSVVLLLINSSLYYLLTCSPIEDQAFLKRIGVLCRLNLRMVPELKQTENAHIVEQSHASKKNALKLLATYYFWQRFKCKKAMHYLQCAMEFSEKCNDEEEVMFLLHLAFEHMDIVRNYQRCYDLSNMALQRPGISVQEKMAWNVRRQNSLQKMMGRDWKNALNVKSHRVRIQEIHKERCFQSLVGKVRNLLMIEANYNVVRNMLRHRECSYGECKRKDVKRLHACSRCQNVFYCCRRHQKLDWKRTHKYRCISID